LFYLHFRFSFR